jgi:predicted flavoprotein YhiN
VTNVAQGDELYKNIIRNPRFMLSAFSRFSGRDMMECLEREGLPLKVERGGRVFPQSDKASDVTKTLQRMMDRAGVRLLLNTAATRIRVRTAR